MHSRRVEGNTKLHTPVTKPESTTSASRNRTSYNNICAIEIPNLWFSVRYNKKQEKESSY